MASLTSMIGILLKGSRTILLVAVFAGLVGGLSGAGLVALVNTALSHDSHSTTAIGGWFAGICLLFVLARIASSSMILRLGENAVFELRLRLSRQILNAPFRRLQELGAPRLLASLTEDISTISEVFAAIPWLCINGAVVLGCLVYLGWLSWRVFLFVIVFTALGIVIFFALNHRAVRALRIAREHDGELYSHFRGLTEGVKELKLHRLRREAFLSEALKATATACRRYRIGGETIFIHAANWSYGLFYGLIGLILFALPAWQHLAGETLSGSILAILFMMGPLSGLLDTLPSLSRASVAFAKVNALEKELDSHVVSEVGIRPYIQPPPVTLELVNVTHRYHRDLEGTDFKLGPLDFSLHPGELIFLIGGNGSGKTTLAFLLVGLYVPESGELRLNGEPVTDSNRDGYREHFSAVFSDFYLFDHLFGVPSGLEQKGREYLVRFQLDHKVQIKNGAFSTTELSQGQRKRLALLTAYLEDRPIYVFDEWAADQDPLFKKLFYTTLLPDLKARGKTIVVITHDDQYFHVADRCIKLESGRFAEYRPSEPLSDSMTSAGVRAGSSPLTT
ncbi:MAG: cyclic peptide export ABC transporter [Gammaproteobacteria bacterium]